MNRVLVHERDRRTEVLAEHEVVVLGGAGTAAGFANFCGLHANVDGEHRQVVHGIADDVLEGLPLDARLLQQHLKDNGAWLG